MNTILTDFTYRDSSVTSLSANSHLHKGYQIIFVASGSVDMQVGDKIYAVLAPSVVILNAFERHKLANASDNYHRYIIELEPMQVENTLDYNIVNMLKLRPIDFTHVTQLDSDTARAFANICENIQGEINNQAPLGSSIILAEITKLLVYIYRKFPIGNELYFNKLALNIRQFIDTHFGENITVDAISKQFFVSNSYLSHLFKAYSGYSVKEYLINTRLYNAQFLLLHTNNSIKNISFSCGYNDINNFIRQFKSQYKLSPLKYRGANTLLPRE